MESQSASYLLNVLFDLKPMSSHRVILSLMLPVIYQSLTADFKFLEKDHGGHSPNAYRMNESASPPHRSIKDFPN